MNRQPKPLINKHLDSGVQSLFTAMGGEGEIRIHDTSKSKEELERICSRCIEEILRIESKYSRYQNSSVISTINALSGLKASPIDEETHGLLKFADELFRSSSGLFDITSGVLRRAWDFKNPKVPSVLEIKDLLPLISWSSVEFDKDEIFLPQLGMEIDFGGFGKEYAVDRAASIVLSENIKSGFVNLAGDIKVIGAKLDGAPWQMGIQNPRQPKQLIASIPIHQGSLATSGDYERFFLHNGSRYCHILRPDTGYPVHYWQSISVLAPMSIVAGSCSTIAMLLQEKGQEYLERTGFSYLAIDQNAKVFKK